MKPLIFWCWMGSPDGKVLSSLNGISLYIALGLGDIYEKLKELVTIMNRVRENTERIAKLEEKADKLNEKVDTGFKNVTEEIHSMRMDMVEMRGDIKSILSQLKTEERMDTLEAMLKEHITACERAKA